MNKFTYLNIENFITKGNASTLTQAFTISEPNYVDLSDVSVGACKEISDNPFFDMFLKTITPSISKYVGEQLMPTYSFGRKYLKGSYLTKHKDRKSCVYTCTLTLNGSSQKSWPIGFNVKNKKIYIANKPGDLLIIRGCDIEHWRNKLTYEHQYQVFFHFVPKTDEFEAYFHDGRKGLAFELDENSIENPLSKNEFSIDEFFISADHALEQFQNIQRS